MRVAGSTIKHVGVALAFLAAAALVRTAFYPLMGGDAFGGFFAFYVYLTGWMTVAAVLMAWRRNYLRKAMAIVALVAVCAIGLPTYIILTSNRGRLIHDAARFDHAVILRCLMAFHFNKNDLDDALLSATIGGSSDIVKYLLLRGANANIRLFDNPTVLMLSVQQGSLENSRLLLQFGAEVNAQSRDGMTALMWAAHDNRLEHAKLLLEAKADSRLQNKRGETALRLEHESHFTEVEKTLTGTGSN